MNKIYTLVLLFCAVLFCIPAAAQTGIGLAGGINHGTITGAEDEDEEAKSRTLFGFGGVFHHNLNKNIRLQVQAIYLQKGTVLEQVDPQIGLVKQKFTGGYIEIPVFLSYLLTHGTLRPYLLGGPSIGLNVSSKFKVEAAGVSDEADLGSVTKTLDFSAGVGGGLEIGAGQNVIFLEGRYTWGLVDIVDDGFVEFMGEQVEVGGDIKTKGLQIMVGITFALGGN